MNESTNWQLALLIIVLFPFGFVLIWGGVVWLLSWLSGWQRLARHYRTELRPTGKPIGPFWAMLGLVSHRGTLTLQAAPEGLYLSIMVLFRIGHPPLLIPWSAIKRGGDGKRGLFNRVALELGDPVITTLSMPGGSVNEDVLAGFLGT